MHAKHDVCQPYLCHTAITLSLKKSSTAACKEKTWWDIVLCTALDLQVPKLIRRPGSVPLIVRSANAIAISLSFPGAHRLCFCHSCRFRWLRRCHGICIVFIGRGNRCLPAIRSLMSVITEVPDPVHAYDTHAADVLLA